MMPCACDCDNVFGSLCVCVRVCVFQRVCVWVGGWGVGGGGGGVGGCVGGWVFGSVVLVCVCGCLSLCVCGLCVRKFESAILLTFFVCQFAVLLMNMGVCVCVKLGPSKGYSGLNQGDKEVNKVASNKCSLHNGYGSR